MLIFFLICYSMNLAFVLQSEINFIYDSVQTDLRSSEINSLDISNEDRKISRFLIEEEISREISKYENAREISKRFIILVGTKWCGAGNKAKHVDELGYFNDTDSCCRHHDHCHDIIEGKGTKYGLKNEDSTTMSHCDCDEEFYACLKTVDSTISNNVGSIFFNILQKKCFREDYPIKSCIRKSLIRRRCKEYELDRTKPKIWQIFDPKEY